ncbi:MAG: hypothetical protein ACRC7S_12275, partial [Cetobacterium sp.]
VWDICSLKAAALWKLKALMDALGMSTEGSIDLDLEEFEGQTCQLEIKIETYEGKEKNTIKSYKGFGSVAAVEGGI